MYVLYSRMLQDGDDNHLQYVVVSSKLAVEGHKMQLLGLIHQ